MIQCGIISMSRKCHKNIPCRWIPYNNIMKSQKVNCLHSLTSLLIKHINVIASPMYHCFLKHQMRKVSAISINELLTTTHKNGGLDALLKSTPPGSTDRLLSTTPDNSKTTLQHFSRPMQGAVVAVLVKPRTN